MPVLRVAGTVFVKHPTQRSVLINADPAKIEELATSQPSTYSVREAYAGRAAVEVQLSTVDDAALRELLLEAWRRTAPRNLVSAYDSRRK
jgi:hypothetical protein